MNDFVLLVVSRLELSFKELVLAYAIVEQLVNNYRVCAQAHTLRPIFLIACVIASKIANDVPCIIGSFYDCVSDVFTATSIPLMKVMEQKILFMLHFELPIGNIHQKCARPPLDITRARAHARTTIPPHGRARRC